MSQHDTRVFELHGDHRPPTIEIADLDYVEANGNGVIHKPGNKTAFVGASTRAFIALEDAR